MALLVAYDLQMKRFLGNLNCNKWRIWIYSLDLAKHIKNGGVHVIFKTMDKIRFSKA